MQKKFKIYYYLIIFICIGNSFAGCISSESKSASLDKLSLLSNNYLDKSTLPYGFGGISGIDFNSATNELYLVSDDKGDYGLARYYKSTFQYSSNNAVSLTNFKEINLDLLKSEFYDFESIRHDQRRSRLYIANEGNSSLMQHPSISIYNTDGKYIENIMIAESLVFDRNGIYGLRSNQAIEGLSLSCDANSLWYSIEGPLIEESLQPSIKNGAITKIFKYDFLDKKNYNYTYFLDPIPNPATGGLFRSDNGISEILEISDNVLLVIERSGYEVSLNNFKFDIRIYRAELNSAGVFKKKILLNLKDLDIPWIDNIESITFGPKLQDGSHTLILFSDDNFSKNQLNQILWFSIN